MSRLAFLAAAALVLPLALLLFAQWPLRDLVQAHSREANDLAQIIFALYMAVAVTWAVDRMRTACTCASSAPNSTESSSVLSV